MLYLMMIVTKSSIHDYLYRAWKKDGMMVEA